MRTRARKSANPQNERATPHTREEEDRSHPSSPATLVPQEIVLVSAATRRAPLLPATDRVCQFDRSSTILGYLF